MDKTVESTEAVAVVEQVAVEAQPKAERISDAPIVDTAPTIPDLGIIPTTETIAQLDGAEAQPVPPILEEKDSKYIEQPEAAARTPNDVLADLINARNAEKRAAETKVALELELVSLLDQREEEDVGSKTYPVGDKKVEIKRAINTSCNKTAIAEMEAEFRSRNLDLSMMPCIMVPEFDEKKLKELKAGGGITEQAYNVACAHITRKPAKISVNPKF